MLKAVKVQYLQSFCQFPEGGVRGEDCGEEAKGHLLPKQSQSSDFLGVYTLPQR